MNRPPHEAIMTGTSIPALSQPESVRTTNLQLGFTWSTGFDIEHETAA